MCDDPRSRPGGTDDPFALELAALCERDNDLAPVIDLSVEAWRKQDREVTAKDDAEAAELAMQVYLYTEHDILEGHRNHEVTRHRLHDCLRARAVKLGLLPAVDDEHGVIGW